MSRATYTMNQNKTKLSIVALTLVVAATASAWDIKVGQEKNVTLHGFLSQGFLASGEYDYLGETTDGSFDFTEVGINATYSPFNRTRLAVQGFAFDVGEIGNLKPFLDYASLEYTFNNAIGIRGGRVRRAAGIYNHIQDVDLARTSVLLPQGMYDARWRDFSSSMDGAVLFGNLSLGKAGSLSYELYSGFGTLSTEGGVARWIEDANLPMVSTVTDFNQPLYLGAQVWWNTPVSGLRAGVSLAKMYDFGFSITTPQGVHPLLGPINAYTVAESEVFVQQYSLEYLWNSWTFQAEYSTFRYAGDNITSVLAGTMPIMPDSFLTQSVGPDTWYVSAAYRVNKWLEVGTYYTEHYGDTSHRSGAADASQKDWALSFRFDAKDWWIIKAEGHLIHGTALLQDQTRNPVAQQDDDAWFLLALKTTFSF